MLTARWALVGCAAVAACAAPAAAQSVSKIAESSAWHVYADDKESHEFCFVTSEPKSTLPEKITRDPARLYISAWPKDGIKSEVSFRVGFPIKKDSGATVTISDAIFKLFEVGDRAYVKDATIELKLVEAMKKGALLKIEMTSERGTAVADLYSLSGLGQALQKLQETCF